MRRAIQRVHAADHRAHARRKTIRDDAVSVVSALEVIGEARGLRQEDRYKQLKLKQDVDAILADCADLAAQHALAPATARLAVEAMLNDQPLPLVGKPLPQFV